MGVLEAFIIASITLSVLGVLRVLRMLPALRRQQQVIALLGLQQAEGSRRVSRGRPVTVRMQSRRQNHPGMLALSTPTTVSSHLSIEPLRALDRLARALGIAANRTSPDTALGRDYLIDGHSEELAHALLRDPLAREAARQLMKDGAHRIQLNARQLTAYFPPSTLCNTTSPKLQLQEWVDALADIAAGLPDRVPSLRSSSSAGWRRLALYCAVILLTPGALVACVLAGYQWPPLDWQAAAHQALPMLAPAAMVTLAIGLLLLRGQATSGRHLPALLPLLLATVPACIAIELARNGYPMQGLNPPQLLAVSDQYFDDQSRWFWRSNQVQTRDLLGQHHDLQVEVPATSRWRAVPLNTARIRLQTAPGARGLPWIAARTSALDPNAAPAATAVAADQASPEHGGTTTRTDTPASSESLLRRARAHDRRNEHQEALRLYAQAIDAQQQEQAADNLRANTYWYRASTYAAMGEDFDAQREADCRAALALLPAHTGAALLLDGVLMRQNRYSEALLLWHELLKERPGYAYGRYKRARVLLTMGRDTEAAREAAHACALGAAVACNWPPAS